MKLFYIIILCFLIAEPVFSQDKQPDRVPTEDSTNTEEITERIDSLEQKIEERFANLTSIIEANQKDTLLNIGSLRIRWDNIPIVDCEKEKKAIAGFFTQKFKKTGGKGRVNIKWITLVIKDGYFLDVQVFAENENKKIIKFTNSEAPISVNANRLDQGEYLSHIYNDSFLCLSTNELWIYEGFGSFAPDDKIITINKDEYKDTGIILTRGVGINSIFDIRLYTDGLAAFGNKSNGLVQTSASVKHFIHRSNYSDYGGFWPFHYMKFNLDLSKFDSQFAALDTMNFSRSTYLQRSWLSSDVALSLFDSWIETKSLSSFYLDFGAKMFLSDLKEGNDTRTTVSYAFFLQPGLDLRVAENFGTDLSTRFFWHFSPETNIENHNKARVFLNAKYDIFWNPLGDESSRIFGRISHTIDLLTKNSFFQLQLGYTVRLSNLINNK